MQQELIKEINSTKGERYIPKWCVIFAVKTTELDSKAPIDPNIFSSYGSLIGGVLGALFSLAGIFLIINTLESQERAIAIQ